MICWTSSYGICSKNFMVYGLWCTVKIWWPRTTRESGPFCSYRTASAPGPASALDLIWNPWYCSTLVMWTVMHSPLSTGRGRGPRRWTASSDDVPPGSSFATGITEIAAWVPGWLVVPMKDRTLSNLTVGKWGACLALC